MIRMAPHNVWPGDELRKLPNPGKDPWRKMCGGPFNLSMIDSSPST